MKYLIIAQTLSFVAVGVLFLRAGQYRLGVAQLLLACVQAIVYTGRMS